MDPKRKLSEPPRGAYCTHRRMRYKKCSACTSPCQVICPDCGLGWMFREGHLGYFYAGKQPPSPDER